jgi:hypothetical protein
MHSLEAIKLSNNRIRHLPPQAFQSITETKAVIDVHGELKVPFFCPGLEETKAKIQLPLA